jgi:hypothetical protein
MIGDILVGIISFLFMVVSKTAVIWAPLFLGRIAFFFWHHYRSEKFIGGMEWVLLEIEIPREITKSPLAMELFLTNALYHQSGKGVWEEYWQGAVHFWYSLELVSIEGRVHFYIRVPSRLKTLVETQLYAQYPQVRVFEVDDYTNMIPRFRNNGNWYMWGCEFEKKKHDAYPIKTYDDYGMESNQKPEEVIDPITPMIEFLGSLERGEHQWIQIIIRHSKKKFKDAHGHMHGNYYDAVQLTIDDLLQPYRSQKANPDGTLATEIRVPKYLEDVVVSMYRSMEKLPFDCGIRQLTLCDKRYVSEDRFQNLRRNSRLLWRQYAFPSLNELVRKNSTQFDTPFSDPTGLGIQKMKSRFLTFYKLRTLFYPPLLYSFNYPKIVSAFLPSGKPNYYVMNTEEIATIFHFPGMVSETPTFKRLESKTAKPPANLPQ